MTVPQLLCPVCQAHPLDPPKACEFCPESAVVALEEIDRATAAAGREIALVAGPAPA